MIACNLVIMMCCGVHHAILSKRYMRELSYRWRPMLPTSSEGADHDHSFSKISRSRAQALSEYTRFVIKSQPSSFGILQHRVGPGLGFSLYAVISEELPSSPSESEATGHRRRDMICACLTDITDEEEVGQSAAFLKNWHAEVFGDSVTLKVLRDLPPNG